jgi:UDP-glucose:(heptosyl)LPS alpha-1,3-glucosyltransferase
MIAQDFARKGLVQAIEAMGLLRDPRLFLVVVGKQTAEKYHQLAEARAVQNQVIFAGPTDDPRSFYSAADFFVLPTRHDPCSLVVLEALAMGLPVVTTAANGAAEIMSDAVHGFVLPDPGDVAALSGAMARLLDDGFRNAQARACLELRPRLSMEFHLDRLEEIYRHTAARRMA